jgi:membrane protein implicated in regulation of membrane protease activity
MTELPVWLAWLIAAIALVLADIFVLGLQFILVVASIAALIAGAVSVAGLGFTGQIWAFVLGVLVLVPVWILLSRSGLFGKKPGPREQGWEKGAEVDVVRQGDRLVGKLKSDCFPIRLADDSQPREGERLIVDRMEGITLIVFRPENR